MAGWKMRFVQRTACGNDSTSGKRREGKPRREQRNSAVTIAPTLRTAVTATAALLVARFLFHPGVFASGHRKVLIRPGARPMDHVHVHREGKGDFDVATRRL